MSAINSLTRSTSQPIAARLMPVALSQRDGLDLEWGKESFHVDFGRKAKQS